MPNVLSDHDVFRNKLKSGVSFLETREETAPSNTEIKKVLDSIQQSVAEYQVKNNDRLKQIEEKGSVDPITAEELKRIKKSVDETIELRSQLEELTKRIGRLNTRKESRNEGSKAQLEHRTAFMSFLRNPNSESNRRRLEEAKSAADREKIEDAKAAGLDETEVRAVATTTGGAGGYAVPEIVASTIQRELSEVSPLRNLVHVVTAGSSDYKELVDLRGATYGWVGETDTRTETGTPTLVEVVPTFGMLYSYPKATEESLQDMFFDVENWLVDAMIEGHAEGEENAIINGDGSKKPSGLLDGTPVVTPDGTRAFGTLQFGASGEAGGFASTHPADPLRSLIYSLKKGYRANARWLMNKATAGDVMLFKDGDGNYLWQPSAVLGQPDRFFGYPVEESEEMPDVAANSFPIAFGDLKAGYLLVDLAGFSITRDEITTPGYVKWYGRRRTGGCKRKSEAVKLLKIAA